jgi:hypothetical protein
MAWSLSQSLLDANGAGGGKRTGIRALAPTLANAGSKRMRPAADKLAHRPDSFDRTVEVKKTKYSLDKVHSLTRFRYQKMIFLIFSTKNKFQIR